MRAAEYMSFMEKVAVDGVKYGDGEKVVKKAAFCFMPTVDVIRAAAAWGADLLVTHEPIFYGDAEIVSDFAKEKEEVLKESGLCVVRWHDSAHWGGRDYIHEGFVSLLGLKGRFEERCVFVLEEETTPEALCKAIEEKLQLGGVRICGSPHHSVKRIEMHLGAPADDVSRLLREDLDLTIRGEVCEWRDMEAIRDAVALGKEKAALVLTHYGSEFAGMVLAAEMMAEKYPEIETKYIDCGGVYADCCR